MPSNVISAVDSLRVRHQQEMLEAQKYDLLPHYVQVIRAKSSWRQSMSRQGLLAPGSQPHVKVVPYGARTKLIMLAGRRYVAANNWGELVRQAALGKWRCFDSSVTQLRGLS